MRIWAPIKGPAATSHRDGPTPTHSNGRSAAASSPRAGRGGVGHPQGAEQGRRLMRRSQAGTPASVAPNLAAPRTYNTLSRMSSILGVQGAPPLNSLAGITRLRRGLRPPMHDCLTLQHPAGLLASHRLRPSTLKHLSRAFSQVGNAPLI